MSRAIKVEDDIYDKLNELRTGRETFSDVIRPLLIARARILEVMDTLESQLRFREWQRKNLDELHAATSGRISSPIRE